MIGLKSPLVVCLALGLLSSLPGDANEPVAYDRGIPDPESVLGYPRGEWVTDYAGMERYFTALASSSPRVEWGSYGTDYERRQLRWVAVSSEANLERLDQIQTATAKLTDPRGLAREERDRILDETPVVVWLNYGIDGNETAGLEAALLTAYHLAASTEDRVRDLLAEAIVLITPVANPSSHERWVSWSNSFAAGSSDPRAMEHNPPWGVLTNNNHYLVDLNRESVWATQRESAALRDLYYEWNPAVFVDLHGEYDNFVGPGYEEPLNPLMTAAQREWLDRFGRSIADRFGERGWSYSPWETGSFYPGFWEAFGYLNGAVGFTFETIGGGSKGLRFRREDGSLITLAQAAEQHFEASLAVIETAVDARRELLADFADFYASALELSTTAPERSFLIDPRDDPGRATRLVEILTANRVEVYRAEEPVTGEEVHDYLGGHWPEKTFEAGTLVVPVDQPQARLLLTMMRKDLRLPEATLEKAEEFRSQQEKAGYYNPKIEGTTYLFYDVTAWSMPLTYGVSAFWAASLLEGALGPVTALESPEPALPIEAAAYGYLIAGDTDASELVLVDLLERGIVVNVANDDFSIADRGFPRGSVLVRTERNPETDLLAVLREVAAKWAVNVVGVDTPATASGPAMGSDRFVWVESPAIAVLAGDPVYVRSFGDIWFTLERGYELSFTAIRREQLDLQALEEYDVLVLPDGGYDKSTFTPEWVAGLKGWISRGGTLVCLRHASSWAADPDLGLSSIEMRDARWSPSAEEGSEPRATRAVAGAILRAIPDADHFLTFGYDGDTPVLVASNLAIKRGPNVAVPFRMAPVENLHLAGFAHADSLERLAETPYVAVEKIGSGKLVLFLDDPVFRNYWQGLDRLFLNSLLLSPSF